MSKFSINYNELSNSVDKKFYKLADVKHKLERVAFDIFKMKDESPDELWQIQSSDDGDYIVARYSEEKPVMKEASKNLWEVLEAKGSVNIFYKSHQITKIAASDLNMSEEDFKSVKNVIPGKLASDKNFVKALFAMLDTSTKEELYKLYPELL